MEKNKKYTTREDLIELAKTKGLPNLVAVLESEDLKNTIQDLQNLDGWIRIQTSLPKANELVLITNGKNVWMGELWENEKEWGVVYDGMPLVESHEIITWQFMPSIPPILRQLNNQS